MHHSDDPIADWSDQLHQGLAVMRIALSTGQCERLLTYLALLRRWNRAYNLSAIRDPALMVRRQLLDSLSILDWVDAGPVLDVGSGAGLPGVPLAVARPDLAFSLLDSNGKKTRFVRQVVAELGLDNVEVLHTRAERLDRPGHYARITSRAFATLTELVQVSVHLLAAGGCWLAMKGARPDDELDRLPSDLVTEVHRLAVPGETGQRHLVVIGRR